MKWNATTHWNNRKRSKQSLHIDAGKTNMMQIGVYEGVEVNAIQAEGGEIESVEEFCYIGSVGIKRQQLWQRN